MALAGVGTRGVSTGAVAPYSSTTISLCPGVEISSIVSRMVDVIVLDAALTIEGHFMVIMGQETWAVTVAAV